MKLKKKYLKWIDKNIDGIDKNKTILVTGATGSIGSCLSKYLSYKGANIILAGRNLENLTKLKEEIQNEFHNNIDVLQLDFANLESVNKALKIIKETYDLDCIVNNAGIYHQPIKYINGIEQTYLVNYLMPVYFFNNIIDEEKFNKTRIINVASISYNYHGIDDNDFTGEHIKNKTNRYSNTKRLLMYYSTYLKKFEGVDAIIAHPGVSTTNLFAKKNKAYPKIFYIFCVPIMKVLFMKPEKASLSLLKAIDVAPLPPEKWVGPRGFLHSWGYPNIQKIKGDITDNETILKMMKRTEIDLEKLK